MNRNTWLVFIVICVAVLGGLIFLSRGERVDVTDIDPANIQEASDTNGNIADHRKGDPEAAVTIIEYGDFQCPGCASAAPTLSSVIESYGDDGNVQLVYRHFPLTSIHPNARASAAAAEAAGLQGKFWEMHDLLFEQQSAWGQLGAAERTDAFVDYAMTLQLDVERFREDLSSDAVARKIDFDAALGRKLSITGTPAIFVNGTDYSSSRIENGQLVNSSDNNLPLVWNDVESFKNLVIEPKLRDAAE